MSSSRWKRFAFFDRSNLALPEAVVQDILYSGNSDSIADEIGLAVVNGAGIPIASIPENPSEDGSGVSGMLQTLLRTGKETSPSKESNYENLNAFQFSNSGKTVSLPPNVRSGKGNVDGSLVLAFLSSKECQRVHCVDLTVRSNPLHKSKKYKETGASLGDLGDEQDLDGWRGYFYPFVHIKNMDSITAASSESVNSTSLNVPKVTSVAVCSDHETDDIKVGRNIYVACITDDPNSFGVTVHRNPHLYLNDLASLKSKKVSESLSPSLAGGRVTPKVECFQPLENFDQNRYGKPTCVDIKTNIVAVGTDIGKVLIYHYGTSTAPSAQGGSVGTNKLTLLMEIPNPHASKSGSEEAARVISNENSGELQHGYVKFAVSVVKLVNDVKETQIPKSAPGHILGSKLFVTYYQNEVENSSPMNSSCGVCCYDLGVLNTSSNNNGLMTPSARYDLDGRQLSTSNLCDIIRSRKDHKHHCDKFMIARTDGLYTYSTTDKLSVSPIDGSKVSLCSIPPSPVSRRHYRPQSDKPEVMHINDDGKDPINADKVIVDHSPDSGGAYVLVATTDSKSGRDAIDIYDTNNKLVAFHLLLSPGHRALRSVGVTTAPKQIIGNHVRGGLSSAIVLTSGGSIVTCTEKTTDEKVALLVQKNLYSAAISVAFADPSYQSSDISSLFRRHAEHLYRKGDFSAAMDQYIHTIGSLESSHVIFRYLDAPKIGLLAKYLEELKSRGVATSVHFELLKTCYLKLNDSHKADKISALISKTLDTTSCSSLISNLLSTPTEALATICTFEAPQAAEALKTYGTVLAKALPKETAGIVISLCDGVYSPSPLAELGHNRQSLAPFEESLETGTTNEVTCDMYPVSDFSSAFLENPKILRVILAHCHKFKRNMDNAHKRMLLELTLEDWNAAKRSGDLDRENIRRESAMALLSDIHVLTDIGEYEALGIVEEQNFDDGIIMMYKKLQMTELLLEKYAEDGSYKARRKMLAICKSDPELLANVLGFFIKKATKEVTFCADDESNHSDSSVEDLLDDIKEGLSLARSQKVLPPVRVARILAGGGTGQFQEENRSTSKHSNEKNSVPLSVALDYIGDVFDESTKVINKLKSDVEDYSRLCDSMEDEINELLSYQSDSTATKHLGIDIDFLYSKVLDDTIDSTSEKKSELIAESFWREMNKSSDRFDTIARFYAKDVLD